MPALIRPRRAADLDGCVAVLAAVHAADHYPLAWPADRARWLTVPERTLCAWVAEDGAEVVGHVVLGDAAPSPASRPPWDCRRSTSLSCCGCSWCRSHAAKDYFAAPSVAG